MVAVSAVPQLAATGPFPLLWRVCNDWIGEDARAAEADSHATAVRRGWLLVCSLAFLVMATLAV